ncbi:hypothetical protein [Desulfobulbus sp.]|uniref:hypothetical protein n=1 Tax=Desulfobulbus sp. TaxID=895 RepID=UPI00286F5FF5|nr:hypothetical protein [Desulfobulbus sp.]
MKNDAGTYIEKPYYINQNLAVTYLLCGALFYNGGMANINDQRPLERMKHYGCAIENQGSNIQNPVYKFPSHTWSPLKNFAYFDANKYIDSKLDVKDSLNVIKKLAFLPVNEEIDREVEQYFASKPIRTKTIFINNRIHKG